MHVQVADNWHPFPALPQKNFSLSFSLFKNIGHVPSSRARFHVHAPPSRRPSSSSQYVLWNIIRSCWKTSFLPILFLSSHMAAEDSKARWHEMKAKLQRDACSLIMIPRLMDTASLDPPFWIVESWVNASLMGSTFFVLYLDRPLAGNNRRNYRHKRYPRNRKRELKNCCNASNIVS